MRESAGSTWTIEAIIFFILLFAAFLSLVIQYSRAYIVKNEVLTIIEKYEGADTAKDIIGNYVADQGYKTKSGCPVGDGTGSEPDWYGAVNYDEYERAQAGQKYYFCIRENYVDVDVTSNTGDRVQKRKYFYEVVFFYKFNLPILGELNTFRVTGETKSFVGADNRLLS